LGLPCAIHAIGDRAIDNVLTAFEQAPPLKSGGRHRIEHLQMIRRKDIARLKRLGVVASMQPSHCPSDIDLIEKYWGPRGRNCYLFKTLGQRGIPLAFGSDAPIEPLDPLAGIHDAVNRRGGKKGRLFYPAERVTVAEAVFGFTAGAAYAAGGESGRGYLLPGYPADLVVLSENIYRAAIKRIRDIKILATFFDGRPVFVNSGYKF
jgi:predicted amidohydrolase YtcJ